MKFIKPVDGAVLTNAYCRKLPSNKMIRLQKDDLIQIFADIRVAGQPTIVYNIKESGLSLSLSLSLTDDDDGYGDDYDDDDQTNKQTNIRLMAISIY